MTNLRKSNRVQFYSITEAIRERILVLDGAIGTELQRIELPSAVGMALKQLAHGAESVCNDALNVCAPEIIEKIHADYLSAGADIIETNTFNANAFSLKEYGMQHLVGEINRQGVAAARRAINGSGRRAWIAGSVGPTNTSLSMLSEENTDSKLEMISSLEDAYFKQIYALIDAGADVILIETIFDTLNAKTALRALTRAREKASKQIPVMLSATLTESGRTLSGQTLEAFVISVSHCEPLAIGLNCGFGAEALIPFIEQIEHVPFAISIYPNAGLPNADGQYDESPDTMARKLAEVINNGKINIVGGCCGTTPAHIREISRLAKTGKPRNIPPADGKLRLAGLEPLTIGDGFIKVGERCNVAGSRKFLRLIKDREFTEALKIAEEQVANGARIIDVNMDDALLNPREDMVRFLTLIGLEPEIAKVPFMVDTSDWNVACAALKVIQGKPVVNSISLKEGEKEFVRRAKFIRDAGAAMIVMAFDEKSQADTLERKIEVCRRAYNLLTQAGIPASDIIFDPNILAIGTGIEQHDNYGKDFIESVEWIKRNLPDAKVSGGLSNLSFSFRGNNPLRDAIHRSFLEHAIPAGMDMAIVNPTTKTDTDCLTDKLRVAVEDLILNRRPDATERLIEIGEEMKEQATTADKTSKTIGKREETQLPSERLKDAIIRGRTDRLSNLIEQVFSEYGTAVEVIDGPLMEGMNEVGRLFGEGKMFLPQVVKSAQAMQMAVEILNPRIVAENSAINKRSAGKMVIATVKGDVHDIGKNIVSVIMRCNGYEVIDLGVMVEKDKIIDTAIRENADFIGLSGLITPSLHEMANVAKEMNERGLNIPLFLGGAAASELHTALKIAPLYSAPVVYTKDAASLPGVAMKFLSTSTRPTAEKELLLRQQNLRSGANAKEWVSLTQARKNRFVPKSINPAKPYPLPVDGILQIPLSQLRDLINWRQFFAAWRLDPEFAEIARIKGCDHCKAQWLAGIEQRARMKASEAMQLFKEANRMLDAWDKQGAKLRAKFALRNATSKEDDIIVTTTSGSELKIPTLRQVEKNRNGIYTALSDFVSQQDDIIGFFVVTTAGDISRATVEIHSAGDEFRSLLAQSLGDRLVEAASEWLHLHVSEKVGASHRLGIRPAVGYPSLPDQSVIFILGEVLNYETLGISLTENGAMSPSSTVSGLMIFNPDSRYFAIGELSEESRRDYSLRRGVPTDVLKKFLPS